MKKNKLSRKLFAVLMALCVILAYTGFAFAGTEDEETTPETGIEVTEPVVGDEPVEGTEEPVVEETTEDVEEELVIEETPAPKAKKAKKASSLSLLSEETICFGYDEAYSGDYFRTVGTESVIMYCMEKSHKTPDENTVYVPASNDLVSSEINAKILKLLYAGYPCNALGIFDDYAKMEGENAKYMREVVLSATQSVLWHYLAGDSSEGRREEAVFDNNRNGDHGIGPFVEDDYDYGREMMKLFTFIEGNETISNPTAISVVLATESENEKGTMFKNDDMWSTKELKLVENSGYDIPYSITVPEGFEVRVKDTKVESIKKDTPFTIVYTGEGTPNTTTETIVSISATAYYPSVKGYYVPEDNTSECQTVVVVCELPVNLSDSITLLTKDDTTSEDKNPTNPGTNPPPTINPPTTPSIPTVTPDGDGTDAPANPEDPSDDEVDSDALGNGGATTVDDDDSIDGDPMGDPDDIEDEEEDVDADALGVKTGDATDMLPWSIGFTAALLGLFVAVKVRRREN